MGAEVEPMGAKEVTDNAEDDSDDPVLCFSLFKFEYILIISLHLG